MKENANVISLMASAYLFACYKCCDMSDDVVIKVVDAFSYGKLMMKMYTMKDAFSQKEIESRKQADIRTHKREYPMDWVTDFKYEEGSQEYWTIHHECGICKLGKQEGCFNIVRYMCKMDYASFEAQGYVLDRTKTLGYGADCCNFHVMTKEKAKEIGFVKGKDAK